MMNMKNVKGIGMVVGILSLCACGKAPVTAAPELMQTLTCEYNEQFPSANNEAVQMILTQNTYGDGSISSTCIPAFPGLYMDISCKSNTEITYTFVNYKTVSGELDPFLDNSGLIQINTSASNCHTSYTQGASDAPIVPKH
jgi:hypothetical protein